MSENKPWWNSSTIKLSRRDAMTEERKSEIRARLAAAQPGPWEGDGCDVLFQKPEAGGSLLAECFCDTATLEMVAHAPTDLADLLKEADLWKLQEERERECAAIVISRLTCVLTRIGAAVGMDPAGFQDPNAVPEEVEEAVLAALQLVQEAIPLLDGVHEGDCPRHWYHSRQRELADQPAGECTCNVDLWLSRARALPKPGAPVAEVPHVQP